MKRFFLAWLAAGCASALGPQTAMGGGDEVIVLYNTRVPESKAVADYYAACRQVPANQIFGFELTTNEDVSRVEFRDSLQLPLAKKLEGEKLWRFGTVTVPATNNKPARVERRVVDSTIRYALLCYGMPLKILRDPNLKESAEENMRPEFRRNEAAVDSELALLPLIEQNLPLAGPLRNPLYTTTNAAALHPTNGVLMVARLDGPSAEIARGLVDKAIEAETNGMWGRAYFDLRETTEANLKQGDTWIRGAAEICRHLGFETVVDTNAETFPASFPMSQIAIYIGWYAGNICGPLAQPNVEFMPGAFAYHLHSFSAATLRSTNENWAGPLLAKGATITMGCVAEPYLGGTPDVAVFTARLIFQGFSFGEAACASQSVLSWQTTVVGDPLYRPFGKAPQLFHLQLAARKSKLLEWSHLRIVDMNLANGGPMLQMVNYLEGLDLTRRSAVLAEKLADLYTAQGKPSSAIYGWQQALKLDPSPQQRVRLRLTLGEKLLAANRDSEAYENFQKLLEESPGYPDKLEILHRLLPLAQKLGKKEDAAGFGEEVKQLTPHPSARP